MWDKATFPTSLPQLSAWTSDSRKCGTAHANFWPHRSVQLQKCGLSDQTPSLSSAVQIRSLLINRQHQRREWRESCSARPSSIPGLTAVDLSRPFARHRQDFFIYILLKLKERGCSLWHPSAAWHISPSGSVTAYHTDPWKFESP